MPMKIFTLIIALFISPLANACDVTEQDIIMAYDLDGGESELKFLDLFWEHGSYIFNATTIDGTELVGNWVYKNCNLSLAFQEGSMSIAVISKSNGVLTVNFNGAKNNALFIKHSI